MPTTTDVIFFDAGGTLLHLDHHAIAEICFASDARPPEDALMAAEQAARAALDELFTSGARSTDASRVLVYFQTMLQTLGVKDDEIAEMHGRIMARHRRGNLWSRVLPRTREALDELRADGFRLAVISNADGRVRDLFRDAGLLDRLELVVDSHEVGIEKPDPEIFHHACREMRTSPDRSMYVGDIYEIDVVGARAAGMPVVLVDALDAHADADVPRIRSVLELRARMKTMTGGAE